MTSDDLPECPLCMVELFYDDLGFYPCSCGYQICRFCWSRILNEENGLCPACRGPYDSEAPASFTPLSEEQFQKLKKEKRNKERRNKTVENRKHLADIRVVQKNLAFVIGLPQRFADTQEILKGPDYFGKYGKVFKVVVNRNAAQPGSQGQGTAGAYVTFVRPEDAIRAILDLNKQQMEGRTLKASLGTTKYCSQFLKGATCTKHECMYLHELGEEAASFTKEEMQQNKHTEYERKLIDEFIDANASIERSLLLSTSSQHHQAQSTGSDSNHHPRQPHTSECRDHSSSSSNSNTPPVSRRATKSESQKGSHSQQQSSSRNQNQQHRTTHNSNSQSSSGECPPRTPRKNSQSHKQAGHHQSGSSRQSPPQQHQRNRQSHHQLHHNHQQPSKKVSPPPVDETSTRQPTSEDEQQSSQQVQSSESPPVQSSLPPQSSQPKQQEQQQQLPQQQELQQQQLQHQEIHMHHQQQQLQFHQQQLQLLQQQFHQKQQQQQQQQQHLRQSEGSSADLRLSSLPPGLAQPSAASHLLPGSCGPLGDSEELVSGTGSTTGSVSSSSASLHLLSSSLSLTTSSSVLNGLNCNYSFPMYSLQFLHDQQQQSDLPSSFEAHRLARSASLTEKSSDADIASLHNEHQYQSLNRASRWPAAAASTHDSPAEVMFCPKDDDAGLDFDPVKESQQGLAALIEDERSLPGGHPQTTSAAGAAPFMAGGTSTGMAPPPGFEVPAYSAPMRPPIPGFPFFHSGLGQARLPAGMDMGVHGGDSDSNIQRHMPAHSTSLGVHNHLGGVTQHQPTSFGSSTATDSSSPDLSFSVKALQDTLRCILPEETTITFDPSFMRDTQPQAGRTTASTNDRGTLQTSTSTKEPTSVWPRNGFRLDDDPAVVASGRDAVHPIQNEFNPFWPTSTSNSKNSRLENEIPLRSEMVWSSPTTTPPGFGSSVLSLLGGLGGGSAAVDVDGQRAVNVDRHTSVTATGDQQISNQL